MNIARTILNMARGSPAATAPPGAPPLTAASARPPHAGTGGKKPPPSALDGDPMRYGELPIHRGLLQALIRRYPKVRTPADEAKALEAHARYALFNAAMSDYYVTKAIDRFREQRVVAEGHIDPANPHSVANAPQFRSEESWIADYETRREALRSKMREITSELYALAETIAGRIAAAAKEAAKEMEAQERAKAEEWGYDFHPSKTLMTLAQIPLREKELLPVKGIATPPAHMAVFIGIDFTKPQK